MPATTSPQRCWRRCRLFAQQQAKLAEHDFKIKTLTFELAFYKRVRFGKASEALVGEQRLLFDELVDRDLAAIDEQLRSQASAKPPRKRAGRKLAFHSGVPALNASTRWS